MDNLVQSPKIAEFLFRVLPNVSHIRYGKSITSHTAEKQKGTKMKNVSIKKILFAILTLVVGFGLNLLSSYLLVKLTNKVFPNYFFQEFITELAFAIISITLIIIAKKKSLLTFSKKGMIDGLKTGAPLIIYSVLLILISLGELSKHTLIKGWEIALFVANCLLIGIAEEALFRGAVQELVFDAIGTDSRKKEIVGIIVASTLFGMSHFINLFAGVSVSAVTFQALSAVATGMVFGAICLLSGRRIWAAALAHAVMDFAAFFNSGLLWGTNIKGAIDGLSVGTLISALFNIGLFIFLMKPKNEEQNKKKNLVAIILVASIVVVAFLFLIPVIMTSL